MKATRRDKKKKSKKGGGKKSDTASKGGASSPAEKDSKAVPASTGDKAEDYRNEQAAREREKNELLAVKRKQLKKAAEEMEAVEAKMRNQMASLRNELRASRALRQSQRKSRKRAAGPTGANNLKDAKGDDGGSTGAALGYLMRSAVGGGIEDDGHFEGDDV